MLEVDIIFILIQFLVVVCRHHRKRLFILIIKSIETRQNVNERERERTRNANHQRCYSTSVLCFIIERTFSLFYLKNLMKVTTCNVQWHILQIPYEWFLSSDKITHPKWQMTVGVHINKNIMNHSNSYFFCVCLPVYDKFIWPQICIYN